jgi:hypothetical protein
MSVTSNNNIKISFLKISRIFCERKYEDIKIETV